MLVLTRKIGQKIHIGSGITVTVIEIKGNRVSIGIDAPSQVPIVRSELNDFLAPTTIDGSPPFPTPHSK